ncbi:coiled-coil domain-containing protein [Streptosporangium sp. NPDC087985]|uniref:coiled-coil domain-containing protein n=1 Tax=Streptosporangium sp. NPDC087985 TaxID=3366196 RepID=UPI00381109B1
MTAPSPMFRRHAALAVSVISALTFALGTAAPGNADPQPDESRLRAELTTLNKKVDKLIEVYAARRESLKKAQAAEGAARADLRKAEEAYAGAERQLGSIAQLYYQSSAGELPSLLFSADMSGVAIMEQLAAEQSTSLRDFARSRDLREQAAEKAAQLTREIGEETKAVEVQREEAEKVIAEIEKKLDALVPTGSGRRADGSWAPQLPTGPDNITDRTLIMREAVKKRFDLPYEVGCYRAENDGGEHPLGRACDFMMSTGGSMPSAANVKLGDEIAAWAVENRAGLGVKYVIWRQRINSGSGWSAMSDRGGTTANHFDHVHISMF